jgi:hypothetical protein
VPELAGLKNGDTFTIYDDGSMTGRVWEGTYIFRPAGTRMPLSNGYVRWRDGLVAIHVQTDPAKANDETDRETRYPFGTYIDQTYGVGINSDGDEVTVVTSQQQVIKRLIEEPTNSDILRLPDNAWLFRADGNGQYVAFVDVYEFKSGSNPRRQVSTNSKNEWEDEGVQPVGLVNQE